MSKKKEQLEMLRKRKAILEEQLKAQDETINYLRKALTEIGRKKEK